MYSSKNILGDILLGTFEQNTVFSTICKPNSAGNRLFLALFLCIPTSIGAYLPPLIPSTPTPAFPSTPTPAWALPPPIVGAHQAVSEAPSQYLALSK
jgi:hypothetical protein